MQQKKKKNYKQLLICDIMEWQSNNQFTYDILESMSIRALEKIHDSPCL